MQRSTRRRWHVLDANAIVHSAPEPGAKWDVFHLHAFAYEELLRLIVGFLNGQCERIEDA